MQIIMANDLYDILGVEKGSNDQEIKRAYRRLAREYHPDVNKAEGAEAKFKEVQSAYDILSDAQKRARYDQFGITDDQPGAGAGAGGFGGGFEGFTSSGGAGFEDAFGDIFDSFFGGSGGRGRSSGQASGEDLRYDMTITLHEAAEGVTKTIELHYLDQKSGSTKSCSQCGGHGVVEVVQRTILGSISQRTTCPACHGTGGLKREKKTKSLDVKIPAGVDTDMKLRMSGEGNVGMGGGPRGDLYVVVTVSKHSVFKREGTDLFIDISVPVSQLVLGVILRVPTLTGKTDLKVPPGTQAETRFRLKGKGIKNIKGYGHGDLYVIVHVDIPTNLSKEETACFKQISDIRNDAQRLESTLANLV